MCETTVCSPSFFIFVCNYNVIITTFHNKITFFIFYFENRNNNFIEKIKKVQVNNFFSHYILINENNKNYNLSLEKYLRTPVDGLLVIFGAFNYMDKKKNSPNFPNLGCLYMNLPIEIIKEIDYTTMSC